MGSEHFFERQGTLNHVTILFSPVVAWAVNEKTVAELQDLLFLL